MNLNINPNGESSSPSAPSDMPDNEEAVAVPESSSRAAKQKCPRRKASPVQCDWEGCGKLFPRPTELHKHVNKVHKPHIPCAARLAPTVHGLPPCDKAYSTKNDMYRHVRSTHPDFAAVKENGIPEEGGLCPICHQRIRDRNSNIKRHIDEVHKNQKRSRRDS
ncbi:hypothetical protein B0T11DRAFT_227283 [Plectosphaerella cucumerina]|uniref:C2H2-type domain-containing protein n=1 Tax=Plectosphaerella cucumerina TaxID=40658 RepID=A0A8K0TFG5_9PEZI|nr:hypothetical protein B0T11DRAFT_227283 [Plectosphaerella cucumerina]